MSSSRPLRNRRVLRDKCPSMKLETTYVTKEANNNGVELVSESCVSKDAGRYNVLVNPDPTIMSRSAERLTVGKLLQCVTDGTTHLKENLLNNADVVLECRACRAVFRNVYYFVVHKDHFCSSPDPANLTTDTEWIKTYRPGLQRFLNWPEAGEASVEMAFNDLGKIQSYSKFANKFAIPDNGPKKTLSEILSCAKRIIPNKKFLNILGLRAMDELKALEYVDISKSECKTCSKVFGNKSNLWNHVKMFHKGSRPLPMTPSKDESPTVTVVADRSNHPRKRERVERMVSEDEELPSTSSASTPSTDGPATFGVANGRKRLRVNQALQALQERTDCVIYCRFCLLCKRKFLNLSQLANHMFLHDKGSHLLTSKMKHKCKVCGKLFWNMLKLQKHELLMHKHKRRNKLTVDDGTDKDAVISNVERPTVDGEAGVDPVPVEETRVIVPDLETKAVKPEQRPGNRGNGRPPPQLVSLPVPEPNKIVQPTPTTRQPQIVPTPPTPNHSYKRSMRSSTAEAALSSTIQQGQDIVNWSSLTCNPCNQKFWSDDALEIHLIIKHKGLEVNRPNDKPKQKETATLPVSDPVEDHAFPVIEDAIFEKMRSKGVTSTCKTCHRTFWYQACPHCFPNKIPGVRSVIREFPHLLDMINMETYSCRQCKKSCNNRAGVMSHLRKHIEKIYKKERKSLVDKSTGVEGATIDPPAHTIIVPSMQVMDNLSSVADVTNRSCKICSQLFPSSFGLRRHFATTHMPLVDKARTEVVNMTENDFHKWRPQTDHADAKLESMVVKQSISCKTCLKQFDLAEFGRHLCSCNMKEPVGNAQNKRPKTKKDLREVLERSIDSHSRKIAIPRLNKDSHMMMPMEKRDPAKFVLIPKHEKVAIPKDGRVFLQGGSDYKIPGKIIIGHSVINDPMRLGEGNAKGQHYIIPVKGFGKTEDDKRLVFLPMMSDDGSKSLKCTEDPLSLCQDFDSAADSGFPGMTDGAADHRRFVTTGREMSGLPENQGGRQHLEVLSSGRMYRKHELDINRKQEAIECLKTVRKSGLYALGKKGAASVVAGDQHASMANNLVCDSTTLAPKVIPYRPLMLKEDAKVVGTSVLPQQN